MDKGVKLENKKEPSLLKRIVSRSNRIHFGMYKSQPMPKEYSRPFCYSNCLKDAPSQMQLAFMNLITNTGRWKC